MKKALSLMMVFVLMLSLITGCSKPTTTEPTTTEKTTTEKVQYPQKEIEFVVPSSPGGGSDFNARTISDIAQKDGFSPESFMVVNKPGGSGAVSFSYVYGKKGDPNTLMVLHSGQVMSAIVNNAEVKADMLTFIGTVGFDELTLCVKADSEYKDIKGLIEAGKANPESIRIGGSQRGNGDHLAFELTKKYTDTPFTYVQFSGSGDVMSALLGGHVEVGIFNPKEAMGQIEAGQVIPIAVYAEERIPGIFKDAPTFKEIGYKDVVLSEVRAISGPPDMPKEAIEFYEGMLKQVTETEEWKKDYIDKSFMTAVYYDSAQTKEFFEKQIKIYTEMFKEVDLIK